MNPLFINNISKAFGERAVLNNVSLSLQNGEIFGVIGLNGIGKTTLIKIILGLSSADSGEIRMFDVSSKLAESRQKVFYLPEKFQPSIFMKGREFIKLSSEYYNQEYDEEKTKEWLKKLDLAEDALAKRIIHYSKGMVQKLGLVAAFLSDLPLLILDEPMSGLDPKARIAVKRALRSYITKGNSVFFTSHILADMEEICDRVAVLNNGAITYLGSPAEFKIKGENLEASFLSHIGG